MPITTRFKDQGNVFDKIDVRVANYKIDKEELVEEKN